MNRQHAFIRLIGGITVAGLALTACGGGSDSPRARGTSQVLPVRANPIANTATAPGLSITSVLVENNEDPATKKDAEDHLEVALRNTSTTALSGFEVYYTITDTKTKETEGYYTNLGPEFTIPAGASRTVHFDQTGKVDHFPDNEFSIYNSSKNALDVKVQVSAKGVAVADSSVKKDAGGAENPDE